MYEEIVNFGEGNSLVGILSNPSNPAAGQRTACLFPNVGLAHRIGPHRLNVRLSRALAHEGMNCLRFDLSGIGDSGTTHSQGNFLEQAVRDMRAAMDHLQSTRGIERFLVFGICSGAVNAYRLAIADPRVVGILMLDGFSYKSRWYKLVDFMARLRLVPAKELPDFLGAIARKALRRLKPQPVATIDASITVIAPPREDFERDISALTRRGVNVFCVFTGGVQVTSGDRDQLCGLGNAAFLQKVRCEYWPEVDHTATALHSQTLLSKALCQWAQSMSGAAVLST
jgi:pimeloyl-ACP methyl ester carboxylesterase